MNRDLEDWSIHLINYQLPKWESLPEIDLYMDQIISYLEKYLVPLSPEEGGKLITSSMINNYVKLKIIPPPVKKKYAREHIAFLVMVCVLKTVLPISVIQNLIACEISLRPINAVYDSFCEEQQVHMRRILEQAGEQLATLDTELSPQQILSSLAMKMALLGSAGKLYAEKAVSLKDLSGK